MESEPNRGTIFHIYLPATEIQTKDEQKKSVPIPTGKETILVAEDDSGVMQFMREALRRFGYQIIEAIEGEKAIDI